MTKQISFAFQTGPQKSASSPDGIHFDLDSFKDKNYLTHNFHPYPAKFVPQIPRNVILSLTEKSGQILDIFCGSGTSLVEASVLGRHSIGLDVHPLACLVSRVKTTPLTDYNIRQVQGILDQVESHFTRTRGQVTHVDNEPLYIPDFLNRDHWFKPRMLRELALLRAIIWGTPDGPALDFLKVAFSAIIVKVSNQDSDTRWVAVEKELPQGAATRAFVLKVQDMVKRVKDFKGLSPAPAAVYEHSVTERFPIPSRSIDLVVTSPPYLNSFDYYLYHKLRLFWLGFDHHTVQSKELGSRNKHCDKGEGIETYTAGVKSALNETFRVLKPGKFLCIVIGDSILKGKLIDMNDTYRSLCKEAGFVFVRTFSYDQRKYTTSFTRNLKDVFKQSHIIFFRRPA
jgi:DNA modification methylase